VELIAEHCSLPTNSEVHLRSDLCNPESCLLKTLHDISNKKLIWNDNTTEMVYNSIENQSRVIYDDIFLETCLDVSMTLSNEEREQKHYLKGKSFMYGEIDYTSFFHILRKISRNTVLSDDIQTDTEKEKEREREKKRERNVHEEEDKKIDNQTQEKKEKRTSEGIFYDLGSGTGKAVLAARLLEDFRVCVGVELLESLHNQAIAARERYNITYKDKLNKQEVQLIQRSLLEVDWSDGDVILANSTCFDDTLMRGMCEMAHSLKAGAIFITFTKPLNSPYFEVLEKQRQHMSWGAATVFIQRRLNSIGTPVGPSPLFLLPYDTIQKEMSLQKEMSVNQLIDLQRHWRNIRNKNKRDKSI